MKSKPKYIIGIDEAGRGPLAGPVAVGVVKTPGSFDWASKLPGVDDSKKLTEEKRAAIFSQAKKLRHAGELDFAVAMVGPSFIDTFGITQAINLAMARCIARLKLHPEEVSIRLDGSLSADPIFTQATIIKGDALYPEIGLASICAKETRDAYMRRIARKYPHYQFEVHKGYGTKAHRLTIAKIGKSPIHRVTYCKNIKLL